MNLVNVNVFLFFVGFLLPHFSTKNFFFPLSVFEKQGFAAQSELSIPKWPQHLVATHEILAKDSILFRSDSFKLIFHKYLLHFSVNLRKREVRERETARKFIKNKFSYRVLDLTIIIIEFFSFSCCFVIFLRVFKNLIAHN